MASPTRYGASRSVRDTIRKAHQVLHGLRRHRAAQASTQPSGGPWSADMLLFLKNLLFTVFVPGTVAIYVPLLMVRDESSGSGISLALSSALFLIGGAIYSWCLWDFAAFGRGTPAPMDAPKRLVVRGLYHYSRNPMYVGVLTAILGWAVLFESLRLVLYALCLGLCFHLFVVCYEEPHLERVHGGSYEDYRARVDRWIPRIGRLTKGGG